MNTRTLAVIAKLRDRKMSDLARLANVSRAAVSLWMGKEPVADIKAKHLQRIAAGLGVQMETLMQSLPLLEDGERIKTLESALLWDGLYRSVGDFAVALTKRDLRAVARLVQVYGMFAAEKIVGRAVWRHLPKYRRYLHPARRLECERLCRELNVLKLV